MPGKTRGASGEMELSYRWHESSSGYNDETVVRVELRASKDGREVFLVRTTESPTLNGERSRSETFRIAANALIQLIEQSGTRS